MVAYMLMMAILIYDLRSEIATAAEDIPRNKFRPARDPDNVRRLPVRYDRIFLNLPDTAARCRDRYVPDPNNANTLFSEPLLPPYPAKDR